MNLVMLSLWQTSGTITLIQSYLTEVCSDMNIINSLPEYTKPKNVGLMFFSTVPDKLFSYTHIDVVQFHDGLGGNNIVARKGRIQQQLRDALQYIRNTIITEKLEGL
ncbi:MAG: hypothetical protein K2I10_12995 [Lachnospiraceae bacterium]|nr:hypothetical protein [Lachnospiraceae bacterium]